MKTVYRIWDAMEQNQTEIVMEKEKDIENSVNGMNDVAGEQRYYFSSEMAEPEVGEITFKWFTELMSKIGFTYFN